MLGLLTTTKNAYFYYGIYGVQIAVAIGAMIYLFWTRKQGRGRALAAYALGALLVAMCPLVILVELKAWLASDQYYKIYYLVPTALLVGVVAADLLSPKKRKHKLAAIITLACIAAAMIGYDFQTDAFALRNNGYHISKENRVLAERLLEASAEGLVIVPDQAREEISEYAPQIRLLNAITFEAADFAEDETDATKQSADLTSKLLECRNYGVTCIVLESEYNKKNVMDEFGYSFVDQEGDYYIYSYEEF